MPFRSLCLVLLCTTPPLQAFQIEKISGKRKNTIGHLNTNLNVAANIPIGTTFTDENDDGLGKVKNTNPDHHWIRNLDYQGFSEEVTALGKQLQKAGGQEDVDHLNKILKWRDVAAVVGILTMWAPLNPISVIALSTWTYASWTMVAHHTCHGGYNRVDAGKFNSRGFAIGNVVRRISDWGDWMLPEAWNIEHNRLHHYHTSEPLDPDLVEHNLEFLRKMEIPQLLKYVVVAALIPIWKWFYYAPNTYKELTINKMRVEGKTFPENLDPTQSFTLKGMFFPENKAEEAMNEVIKPLSFFQTVLMPFLLARFILLPAPLLFIPTFGSSLFGHAILNLIVAELVTNIHSFATIVTNHAGEDLYKFDDEIKPKSGSFYVRQIVSSVNFATGTDPIDFSHGWLNYQIEHHVWPDLSMLQYQKGAPKLKAICAKYGVPYIQESVWTRVRKTIDIMVGNTSMKTFPTQYEPEKDKATKGVTWRSTNGAIDDQ